MFFYEREKWERSDFSCVLGFTDPVHRDNCVLADQDMQVADFWRKRGRKKEKKDSPSKRAKTSEEKCSIHSLTADDTPAHISCLASDAAADASADTSKHKAHSRAMAALEALDTAKALITTEGKEIEPLPQYFHDLSSVMKWTKKVWRHDRHACQASAQMRFERNIHAIYFFRLKYTTQYLYREGDFEQTISSADSDRVRRYIRGAHRLTQLMVKHGLAILLLVNDINAYTIGQAVKEREWKAEADGLLDGQLLDAFNLVNAEFIKDGCSWTQVPALEQIAQWLFQPEFISYRPYNEDESETEPEKL